jgi:hypothetical protein
MGRPPPECNEEEDDATELGERVCKPDDWGGVCALVCKEYGVFCASIFEHRVTKKLGQLYKCCNCKGDKRCHYIYDDGKKCIYWPETGGVLCP